MTIKSVAKAMLKQARESLDKGASSTSISILNYGLRTYDGLDWQFQRLAPDLSVVHDGFMGYVNFRRRLGASK